MFKAFIVAAAVAVFPLSALAAEPNVVWRSSQSGVLAPQAAAPSVPGSGQGAGHDNPLILEAPSEMFFYTNGATSQMKGVGIYNGTGPYSFSIAGTLPNGLTFIPNSNGADGSQAVIKGRPSSVNVGGSAVTITGSDSTGRVASRTVNIRSLSGPMLGQWYDQSFKVGANLLYNLDVVNAVGKVTYQIFGKLPAGLAIEIASGKIFGVPINGSEGTYSVNIRVTDSIGQAYIAPLDITVTN